MGCCNNDKCSESQTRKTAKRIPWFAIVLICLALLVVINWQ
ncbi:hypothetical protein [Vibrio taketomensis]|nr:hypothetical protein [Vibrio taketomensis]